jgi:hypothetical protein
MLDVGNRKAQVRVAVERWVETVGVVEACSR